MFSKGIPSSSFSTTVCFNTVMDLRLEQLAVQFNLEETLQDFTKVFKNCQADLRDKKCNTQQVIFVNFFKLLSLIDNGNHVGKQNNYFEL